MIISPSAKIFWNKLIELGIVTNEHPLKMEILGHLQSTLSMNQYKSYGKIAYEAYRDTRNGVAVNGQKLPPYEDMDPIIQLAWDITTQVVVRAVLHDLQNPNQV